MRQAALRHMHGRPSARALRLAVVLGALNCTSRLRKLQRTCSLLPAALYSPLATLLPPPTHLAPRTHAPKPAIAQHCTPPSTEPPLLHAQQCGPERFSLPLAFPKAPSDFQAGCASLLLTPLSFPFFEPQAPCNTALAAPRCLNWRGWRRAAKAHFNSISFVLLVSCTDPVASDGRAVSPALIPSARTAAALHMHSAHDDNAPPPLPSRHQGPCQFSPPHLIHPTHPPTGRQLDVSSPRNTTISDQVLFSGLPHACRHAGCQLRRHKAGPSIHLLTHRVM